MFKKRGKEDYIGAVNFLLTVNLSYVEDKYAQAVNKWPIPNEEKDTLLEVIEDD